METDSSGRETKRQLLVSDVARRKLQGDDYVANILFFDPDPPPATESWTAERALVANGTRIAGAVTYKKALEADGVTTYAVSSSLHPAADSTNPSVRNFVCDIQGEQSYDAKTHLWKNAKLPAHIHFTMQSPGKPPVQVKADLIFQVDPITLGK